MEQFEDIEEFLESSSTGGDKRLTKDEAFRLRMQELGLVVKPIKGDGHCLFSCVRFRFVAWSALS